MRRLTTLLLVLVLTPAIAVADGWDEARTFMASLGAITLDVLPAADNTCDLGSAEFSWQDMFVDGTSTLATVDINGGTLDGVGIGASVTGRGAFSGITFDGTTANDAALAANGINLGTSGILFEGSSGGADASETILSATNPTADRAINLPNLSGTLLVDTAENAGNAIILGTLDLGKDDDISTLTIHDAGTIVLYDDSDDTSVTIGPVGNGGTVLGVTGTVNATALQESGIAVLNNDEIDASSELAAIMDDETGTAGSLVFSASPALTGLPTLGNAATSSGTLKFLEDSDNGSNGVTLAGPASTADVQIDLPALAGTVALLGATNTAGALTLSQDGDNAAKVVATLTNSNEATDGQIGDTASLSFNLMGGNDVPNPDTYSASEAGRIEVYKTTDWLDANTKADWNSGFKLYPTFQGSPLLALTIAPNRAATFADSLQVNGGVLAATYGASFSGGVGTLITYADYTTYGEDIVYEGDIADGDELIIDVDTAFDAYDTAGAEGDITITVPALTGYAQVNGVTDLGADADDAYTALVGEAGTTYTNTSDSDALVITLPNDPVAGTTYSAAVVIAQTIQILPGAGESLYSGTTACATSYIGTGIGSTTTVRAVTGGAGAIWMVMTGTAGWVCTP